MAKEPSREVTRRRRRPATTPEAREQEVAWQAYDLAEEQIQNGTASSQVITHFLKVGSRREQLEQLRIAHEVELMEVKKRSIEDESRREDRYLEAIEAMKSYSTTPQLPRGDAD